MLRFLADASLNHCIVTACNRREPSIDFISAAEAELEGLSDPEVLALAASDRRILVTHDVHTMPKHFSDFLIGGGISPGVFLVRQRVPISEVADALILIWFASDASEWENRILEVPF
jgi:predicted nuclease of predicted toxin-antitoxin system